MTVTRRGLLIQVAFACVAPGLTHGEPLKTVDAVLDRYKKALGGVEVIARVQSQTVRGEIESTGMAAKLTFTYFAKPFKTLIRIAQPDGSEVMSGFDGTVSWSVGARGASIDKDTAPDAVRRDADLQYALHQRNYFKSLEFN